ncbi:hypothetical protein [Devosia sp.]|uniref:hypothetical protein n=1 Tax=Devosia sp. TaxID=1871048 RepID=UPI0027365CEC|nr:hypothetical protein [Devosia sp.]MDP2778884.1 hypothetical protein [Devosia sp.]
MITRVATFEGVVAPENRDAFYAHVRQKLMPLWQQFPGAREIDVHFPYAADPMAPPVALLLTMRFDDQAALEVMLASDVRAASKPLTAELLTMLEGRLYHHVFVGA